MGSDRLNSMESALDHPQRRAVVRHLVEEYLPIPVPSFTTYLALRLFADEETDDFEAFREGLHRSLTEVHLPELNEAGIVDYDPDLAEGIIDKGPEFDAAVTRLKDS